MSAIDYLSRSTASAPDIPILIPSFAASFETLVMMAVSISSCVLTSETVAHTSSIQAEFFKTYGEMQKVEAEKHRSLSDVND